MITSRRCIFGLTLIAVLFAGGFADAAKKKKNEPAYTPEEGSAELDKKAKRAKRPKKPKEKVVIDPSLPNVLIIGDSISIGYTPKVRELLKGKANVIHNPGNAQGTTLGREKLSDWLGDTQWDVIHFNWGLHDLKHVTEAGTSKNSNDPADPQQADLATYTANMEILAKQLKANGAKLIFATTTPYPAGVKPCRKPEYAGQYNAAALKIMKANGIVVDDLHGLILPRMAELQKPVNVHFNPEGSQLMAEQVVKYILTALGK
ncbi:MAG: SGNH/GDSL hydrolase family protein [Kiritimatiellales bacterium]|nr:SGNH/GDSL hydrolase family protein [Kiritimatiellales bacterium]